jgi:hypothetical protein
MLAAREGTWHSYKSSGTQFLVPITEYEMPVDDFGIEV